MGKPGRPKGSKNKPKEMIEVKQADGSVAIKEKPKDVSLFIEKNMELFNLPKIDMFDQKQVEDRINEYFEINIKYTCKPTVAGLAMALGIDRNTLSNIRTGKIRNPNGKWNKLPEEVVEIVRKAYDYLEMMWEDYMQNNKINPVSGIFLGKNNYGYKDKTETQIEVQDYVKPNYDAQSIREKYAPRIERDGVIEGEYKEVDTKK